MNAFSRSSVRPIEIAWLLRADLRDGQSADSDISEAFRAWWAVEGSHEYPMWRDDVRLELKALLMPLSGWPRYGAFGMSPILLHLTSRRSDLAQAFDVRTETGLWHAIAWFYVHGVREYGLADLLEPSTIVALDGSPPFFTRADASSSRLLPTWLMFFVWRCSKELQDSFDLREPSTHISFIEWFLFEGVPNIGLSSLVASRWILWLREPLYHPNFPKTSVPRAGCLLWRRRENLRSKFTLQNEASWNALASWTNQAWDAETSLVWANATNESSALPIPPTDSARPFGVNLIGFAFGELGIGEDVRMAVEACQKARIPFSVLNIEPGGHLRQGDRALAHHVDDSGIEAPYAINIFCLTGFDTARVLLERGASLFHGRVNIGWWPWELPVWPKAWLSVFNLIDEVWSATRFTEKTYECATLNAEITGPVVVTHMPLPASISRVKPMSRVALGLPSNTYLFLYVFDFNSYLARKNPFAAIAAFRRAFPQTDSSVGLVLKTMNSNPQNLDWKKFQRECEKDSRIVLLDKTLERGEVLGLIQACDAYVSLHRSEGFGRTLAEAMLFGKPVVGTNFSGNVDFLNDNTGFPVRWKPVVVRPGEYPFVTPSDAAWWANVETSDAAVKLKAARATSDDFKKRVENFASTHFSPKRIGSLMKERLLVIWSQHLKKI